VVTHPSSWSLIASASESGEVDERGVAAMVDHIRGLAAARKTTAGISTASSTPPWSRR
jgi:hypothetical protein